MCVLTGAAILRNDANYTLVSGCRSTLVSHAAHNRDRVCASAFFPADCSARESALCGIAQARAAWRINCLVMGRAGQPGGGARRSPGLGCFLPTRPVPTVHPGAGVEPITGVSVSANPQCDVRLHVRFFPGPVNDNATPSGY